MLGKCTRNLEKILKNLEVIGSFEDIITIFETSNKRKISEKT